MILKVVNIQKSYKRQVVLKEISFEIHKPQIVALIGPNGSGKSTLMNIITNLLQADRGTVTILGKSNTDPDIFSDISFMQDNTVLYDYLTGYDHLQFIADVQSLPKKRIIETAQRIGNESYLHKRVKNYSLGMKQHLLLAMAIMNHPKLLILDEPLNGLDPTSAIRVRELLLELKKDGTAILLSSHNLGEIDQITSDILFLKKGHLINEDLSLFEENVYLISVDQLPSAVNTLHEHHFDLSVVHQRLKFSERDNHLNEVLLCLQSQDLQVLDIEKVKSGSEARYRQIFGEKDENDGPLQI